MDKVKLAALIALLYAREINLRDAMVKDAAKENGVKEGDLYKLLKEAGYDPKAPKGTAAPSENAGPNADGNQPGKGGGQTSAEGKKISVILRHQTEYPKYRRAGLVLTRKAETYEVTEEQLAALKQDKWVVIEKEGGDTK
jgi:hypothetical protein